jgi:hydrogenase nickel insertion protein HypA
MMHEMSLVQTLFLQLQDLARDNGATKIRSVTMEIGPLSGVVIDSFQFGFEILAAEQEMTKDARLIIEIPTVRYTCITCNKVLTTAGDRPQQCDACEETLLIPEGGDDLLLMQVEME